MRVRHRAHWGAWASRRDLGFCGGVTYAPLGIQALKPFLVCSELRPDQRHRNPHRPQSLVGRSVSPVRQSATCSQHSLGVAKRSMSSPSPTTGPREDGAGLERRQGSLAVPGSSRSKLHRCRLLT
jgi:hypothetical protein